MNSTDNRATVFFSTGRVASVKNLGWLLRHAAEAERIEVRGNGLNGNEASLIVSGQGWVFYTPFASAWMLERFIQRPSLAGLPVDIDYRRTTTLSDLRAAAQPARPAADPTHPLHPEPAWARPSAAYLALHNSCRHAWGDCEVERRAAVVAEPNTLVSGAQGATTFAQLQPGTLVADEIGRVYGTVVGAYVSPDPRWRQGDANNLLVVVRTDQGDMSISGRYLQPLVHGPAEVEHAADCPYRDDPGMPARYCCLGLSRAELDARPARPAVRWTWGVYSAGAAYPEGSIRIEESPGARLVANLPPYRTADAQAICDAHNGEANS